MTDERARPLPARGRGRPGAERAFDGFHERWKDDHLVIDNWFADQAQSPLAGTLARVEALMRHPLFSIKNPNKVRALIGTFAAANPVKFNRPDGAGYDFVADRVLELDRFNPQIAARLLGAFRSWRTLETRPPGARPQGAAADREGQILILRRARNRLQDARRVTSENLLH